MRSQTAVQLGGLAALMLASGCDGPFMSSLLSLNPIATESQTVVDSGLAGVWDIGDGESGDCSDMCWQFTLADSTYTLTIIVDRSGTPDSNTRPLVMFGRLTRIGEFGYLDFVQREEHPQPLMMSLHWLWRAERRGDSLEMVGLGEKAMNDSTVLNDAPTARRSEDDSTTILTASTEELRKWIERHFAADSFTTAGGNRVPYGRLILVRRVQREPRGIASGR